MHIIPPEAVYNYRINIIIAIWDDVATGVSD